MSPLDFKITLSNPKSYNKNSLVGLSDQPLYINDGFVLISFLPPIPEVGDIGLIAGRGDFFFHSRNSPSSVVPLCQTQISTVNSTNLSLTNLPIPIHRNIESQYLTKAIIEKLPSEMKAEFGFALIFSYFDFNSLPPEVQFPFEYESLGMYLNLSRETISRCLSPFASKLSPGGSKKSYFPKRLILQFKKKYHILKIEGKRFFPISD